MNTLKIGWAEANITPDKKVSLVGQFAERISEYVEKPLTATALAIESGNEQVIFCSCDLLDVSLALIRGVRERLSAADCGIDPERVIMSAIHTHTGPGYTSYINEPTRNEKGILPSADANASTFNSFIAMIEKYLAPGQKYVDSAKLESRDDVATDREVYDLLVERISKAIIDAWNTREEGSLANAFGRAPVGMCRRAVYSDNTAQMWGNTDTAVFTELEGGNDSGIELLYIFGKSGELTGVVANLACPAQCVQHRHFVSPDFWGEVKALLRRRFGENIFLLAQCSAAGDQCPVDIIRYVEPESPINDPNCERVNPKRRKADPSMFDLAGMRLTGRRIANEIIAVFEDGLDEKISEAPLMHSVDYMMLPLRRVTLTEINEAEKAIGEYIRAKDGDIDFNDVARLQIHIGTLMRASLQEKRNCYETEVHTVRLGNIAFATNPFELFLNFGNQIKARSDAEQTFLIQLACGSAGYLPTAAAEVHGHYSAFVSSGKVGHEGGDVLVRQTLQHISDMFR